MSDYTEYYIQNTRRGWQFDGPIRSETKYNAIRNKRGVNAHDVRECAEVAIRYAKYPEGIGAPKHKDHTGKSYYICTMTDQHLRNTIRFIERHMSNYKDTKEAKKKLLVYKMEYARRRDKAFRSTLIKTKYESLEL